MNTTSDGADSLVFLVNQLSYTEVAKFFAEISNIIKQTFYICNYYKVNLLHGIHRQM